MSLLSLALLNLTRKKNSKSFETFFEGDLDKMLLNNIYTMFIWYYCYYNNYSCCVSS